MICLAFQNIYGVNKKIPSITKKSNILTRKTKFQSCNTLSEYSSDFDFMSFSFPSMSTTAEFLCCICRTKCKRSRDCKNAQWKKNTSVKHETLHSYVCKTVFVLLPKPLYWTLVISDLKQNIRAFNSTLSSRNGLPLKYLFAEGSGSLFRSHYGSKGDNEKRRHSSYGLQNVLAK